MAVKIQSENYLRIDPVIQGVISVFILWTGSVWIGPAKLRGSFCRSRLNMESEIKGSPYLSAAQTGNLRCSPLIIPAATKSWAKFTEDNRRDLILIAHYFNEKALEFEPDRQPEQQQSLSPREVDAMTLLRLDIAARRLQIHCPFLNIPCVSISRVPGSSWVR